MVDLLRVSGVASGIYDSLDLLCVNPRADSVIERGDHDSSP